MEKWSLTTLASLLYFIPSAALAGNSLAAICSADGGRLVPNVKILKYVAANTWADKESTEPSAHIMVNDEWYGIFSKDVTNGGGTLGIQQFAQTMALRGENVDICVRGNVLRGIENAIRWPHPDHSY